MPNAVFAAQESDSVNNSIIAETYKIESLMTDSEEMKKINQAFAIFISGGEFKIERNDENLSEEDITKIKNEEFSKELMLIEEKSKIYLGSILYFSNDVWSIWLNGDKLTSDSNDQESEFYVEKISGKKVDFVWRISISKWKILMSENAASLNPKVNDSSEVVIKFSLKPNQTYLLRQDRVVEGNRKPNKPPTVQKDEEVTQNQNNETTVIEK